MDPTELSAELLRIVIDPASLHIDSSDCVEPLDRIIGQPRAVSAIRFGLEIQEIGYNICVAGPPGIGKMTAVQSFLQELARGKETPTDWCYVNNFEDPYQPKVCRLPTGRGRQLQQDMKNLIDHMRREIPKTFESEDYGNQRDEILNALKRRRDELFGELSTEASQAGFALQATSLGIAIIPVSEEKPLNEAQIQALPAAARETLQKRREALQEGLKSALKEVRNLERKAQTRMQDLDRRAALYVVEGLIDDLKEKYSDCSEVPQYLQEVQTDILENIEPFKGVQKNPATPGPPGVAGSLPWLQELPFRKYFVNVVVDNSHQKGAPIVVELNPSYTNLFGRVEKETQLGALYTDFTMIRAGSLQRGNGGYLVIPLEEVLRNPPSWKGLKRTLRSRQIEIEELGDRLGFPSTKSLRPQAIPFEAKVLLVGRPLFYYLLHQHDEDFAELFKVKADFDTRMDREANTVQDLVSFFCALCQKENLKHLDRQGMARALEYASRLADHQEKLTTHFGALADLIRESHFWADQDKADLITGDHVRKALDEKIYRSNLIQKRIEEMIQKGTLLIDTDGEEVGQGNGLSVISLGDYQFGRPSRITASVGPGRQGIMDIEREVELGGPLHSKGVLILNGYLTQRFAQDKPLTLGVRLVFEQSYEGIDGDSASSTELYALLSALSGVPIRQGIAVTGSVNQYGAVQAIGGVNQKVEGFFDVCQVQGLSGRQGVLIPDSNKQNLMLREDVVEAVRSGQFHIWAVKTIDEGIQVLTGWDVGKVDADGHYPEDSINHRVDQRLRRYASALRVLAGADSKNTEPVEEKAET